MMNSTAPPPSSSSPSSPSFSSVVPDEIAANCLARVPKSEYSSLSSVSKGFNSLLSSPEIYAARSEIGATEPRLYLLCERKDKDGSCSWCWYNLRFLRNCDDDEIIIKGSALVYEGEIKINRQLSLVPLVVVTSSSARTRTKTKEEATFLALGSEIYQFGESGKRSRSVRVFDCRSHTQRRAPNMRMKRECAKACHFDGNIYVMGGCRERECFGEVFDLKTQTWNKHRLPPPPIGDEFDCKFELLVLGARIYVITEPCNKYNAYDPKQGRWLDMGFAGLKRILEIGMVWCVLDNLVFMESLDRLWWYDLSKSGKWFEVEGLTDLLHIKVECFYRMIQLVNYGGKLVMVWLVLPDFEDKEEEPSSIIPQERIWFAVIRLEKRLTSSGLAISGEIEQLNYLVHGSCNPLTCLSVSL